MTKKDVTLFVMRMGLENNLLSSWNGVLHLKGFSVFVLSVNQGSKTSHKLRFRKLVLECLNSMKNLVAAADLHSQSFGAVIDPFTPKISIVILLTLCRTILMMLVWRIWS